MDVHVSVAGADDSQHAGKISGGQVLEQEALYVSRSAPLLETVPPSGGQLGVPTGPGAVLDPHSHKKIPPLTAGWPKWMCAMNAGLDSFE